MSILEGPTLLSPGNHNPSISALKETIAGPKQAGGVRTRASVAALVEAVRDPRSAVEGWWDGLTREEREEKLRADSRRRVLYIQIRNATSYDVWKSAAVELDDLENNNTWKRTDGSSEYTPQVIQERLNQLEEARINCDVRRMIFLIRTSLTRNLGNMGNIDLYKHSHVGTKDLIERYINSALNTLNSLLELSDKASLDGFGPRHMMEQVLLARQAFGRSALLLSGGATFGMCHSGVLKALWEQKLLPRIISGASAGSIVCAVLCTRTDEEVPELLSTFCHGDLAVFEDNNDRDGVLQKLARFLKYGALFDISHLTRVMKDLLGDMTFQEAYNRTRRILNICVSSASLYELPRLLNYITAPNVLIWSAVAASCSVPVIFSAASILAKDPRTGEIQPWNSSPQKWIDGSVDNDLPMTRLAEMFNVNHFIVSQVNPHVVPFIKDGNVELPEANDTPKNVETPSWVYTMTHLAKSEVVHRMHSLIDLGVFPTTLTKTISVLNQKYSGDITILPEISYSDMPRLLSNPTVEFMEGAMLSGERATWPKLSRIRNHLAIELALDETAQRLRERVVFSSSQVDLRLPYSKAKVDGRPHRPGTKVDSSGRRPRKWSQSSEPDASTADTAKYGRKDYLKPTSHHKSQSLYSASRQDLEAVPQIQLPQEHGRLTTDSTQGTPDLTSSGAETSNIYTSDSFADHSSSSTESPTSPDFSSNETKQFSYSVPATPAGYQRSSSYMNVKSSGGKALQKAPAQPLAQASSKPSAAEHKYRSLFHGSRAKPSSRSGSSAPQTDKHVVQEAEKRNKKLNALGLSIDISGTRNMMSRRKA